MNLPAVLSGVPIDAVTMEGAIARLDHFVDVGRRRQRVHQVATVNVDFLVNALTEPRLLAILQGTAMNLPDGMPIVWMSRLLGTPIGERVAGADLVPFMAAESQKRGWRMHLFGGRPGVAHQRQRACLCGYCLVQCRQRRLGIRQPL